MNTEIRHELEPLRYVEEITACRKRWKRNAGRQMAKDTIEV
jgi:hypothetical protein